MFGYIKPHIPQLRVCEHELYKAIYCGLCCELGKSISCRSRFTLNYDFVFLALLRFALEGKVPEITPRRCIAHPAKKRAVAEESDVLGYCASASILLMRAKLKDDISDSKGLKKAAAYTMLPLASDRRLSTEMRRLETEISEKLSELSSLEKVRCKSIDAPADIFGEVCSLIFSFGLSDVKASRLASEIGRHIGRWIYVIDAADDFEKDLKSGNYNPLAAVYGNAYEQESVKNALLLELAACETAFDLIDCGDPMIDSILKNIIYLGMPAKAEKVLNKAENCSRLQ